MTTLVNQPRALHASSAETSPIIGRRMVLCWPCTRRRRDGAASVVLEQAACMLSLQVIDGGAHATIECWIESDGRRQRTVLHSTTRPCSIIHQAGQLHMDVASGEGARLAALTIDLAQQRVLYAHSTLLAAADFHGGTYDSPRLLDAVDQRLAQSA